MLLETDLLKLIVKYGVPVQLGTTHEAALYISCELSCQLQVLVVSTVVAAVYPFASTGLCLDRLPRILAV